LNIYDTRIIKCIICERYVGEIEYDAKVIRPLCGKCADPLPEGDKILYTVSHYQNIPRNKEILPPIIQN
jgi:hypothetical protein